MSAWAIVVLLVLAAFAVGIVAWVLRRHRALDREFNGNYDGPERREEQPATAGAQRQINAMREDFRIALKALGAAGAIFLAVITFVVVEATDAATDAEAAVEQVEGALAGVEEERTARATSVEGIIRLFCGTNNQQDEILADLVSVSIASQSTFGEGIDFTKLDDFDIAVLQSIQDAQELQQAAPGSDSIEGVFTQRLEELETLLPCGVIARAFEKGEPVASIDDLEQKRRRIDRAKHVRRDEAEE